MSIYCLKKHACEMVLCKPPSVSQLAVLNLNSSIHRSVWITRKKEEKKNQFRLNLKLKLRNHIITLI